MPIAFDLSSRDRGNTTAQAMMIANPAAASGVGHGKLPVTPDSIRPGTVSPAPSTSNYGYEPPYGGAATRYRSISAEHPVTLIPNDYW